MSSLPESGRSLQFTNTQSATTDCSKCPVLARPTNVAKALVELLNSLTDLVVDGVEIAPVYYGTGTGFRVKPLKEPPK